MPAEVRVGDALIGASGITVSPLTGWQAGDLMLVVGAARDGDAVFTAPGDFSTITDGVTALAIDTGNVAADDLQVNGWFRILDEADTSWNWTWTGDGGNNARFLVVLVKRGTFKASDPFEAVGVQFALATDGANIAPSKDIPDAAGYLLLTFHFHNASTTSMSAPLSMSVIDYGSGRPTGAAYQQSPAEDPTGAKNAVMSGGTVTRDYAAATVVIAPETGALIDSVLPSLEQAGGGGGSSSTVASFHDETHSDGTDFDTAAHLDYPAGSTGKLAYITFTVREGIGDNTGWYDAEDDPAVGLYFDDPPEWNYIGRCKHCRHYWTVVTSDLEANGTDVTFHQTTTPSALYPLRTPPWNFSWVVVSINDADLVSPVPVSAADGIVIEAAQQEDLGGGNWGLETPELEIPDASTLVFATFVKHPSGTISALDAGLDVAHIINGAAANLDHAVGYVDGPGFAGGTSGPFTGIATDNTTNLNSIVAIRSVGTPSESGAASVLPALTQDATGDNDATPPPPPPPAVAPAQRVAFRELSAAERRLYQAALRDSGRVRALAWVYDRDELLVEPLEIAEGQVDADLDADITRSVRLTVDDPSHRLGFAPFGKVYADNFIRVTYAVLVDDVGWVLEPVFHGPVSRWSRDGHEVEIEAIGKEALMLPPVKQVALTDPDDRLIVSYIRAAAALYGEAKFALGQAAGRTVPKSFTVSPAKAKEKGVWWYLRQLAESANLRLFYDGRGYLTLEPHRPNRVAHTFNRPLTEPAVAFDLERVRNVVEVYGQDDKARDVLKARRALAVGHPLSAQSLARNGKPRWLLETVKLDDTKLTEAAAAEIADRKLKQLARQSVEVQFEHSPVPHLELGETCRLVSETADQLFTLRQFSLPLGPASMSVGYTRARPVAQFKSRRLSLQKGWWR